MLVCDECGGKNVHIVAWVNANTLEYKSSYGDGSEDNWREDCQAHVSLKTERKKKDGKSTKKG